jgi:hypothetical protein
VVLVVVLAASLKEEASGGRGKKGREGSRKSKLERRQPRPTTPLDTTTPKDSRAMHIAKVSTVSSYS